MADGRQGRLALAAAAAADWLQLFQQVAGSSYRLVGWFLWSSCAARLTATMQPAGVVAGRQ
jgi:hypothetical protein